MAIKCIGDIVSLMRPDVEGIAGTTEALFFYFRDPPVNDLDIDSFIENYLQEVIHWILDQMATGEIKKIGELSDFLHRLLSHNPEEQIVGIRASEARYLAERLRGIRHFIIVYQSTANLTRLSGLLSGSRRHLHRCVLRWMYARRECPIKIKDLFDAGSLQGSLTAYIGSYAIAKKILKQLTAWGLLWENKEGRILVYELSWSGCSYCRAFF